MSKTKS